MTNSRHYSSAAAVLIVALLPALPESPAQPAPRPVPKPALRLVAGGQIKIGDLWVDDAAVIDEDTVVLVGTKWDGGDMHPLPLDENEPKGMFVDLAKKTTRPFTNGHKSRIYSVSVSRGRVVTTSDDRDPTLRVWNLKAGRSVAEVTIEMGPFNPRPKHFGVGCFHKSDRVAIAAGKRVIVLDPAKPDDRAEFGFPSEDKGYVSHPVIVSPDDAWIAATSGGREVAVWEVATRKVTLVSLVPKGVDDPEQWFSHGVAFGPSGLLIAWRNTGSEVPAGKAEADVPADRRSIVLVERDGQVTPVGLGHTGSTFYCAVDPTGAWLASVGLSRRDKPRAGGDNSVGELRVYHLPSGSLAFREQVEGFPLSWVAFTPSGKRVVAAHGGGTVRWWDVQGK